MHMLIYGDSTAFNSISLSLSCARAHTHTQKHVKYRDVFKIKWLAMTGIYLNYLKNRLP